MGHKKSPPFLGEHKIFLKKRLFIYIILSDLAEPALKVSQTISLALMVVNVKIKL